MLARVFSVAKDRGLIGTNPCERGGRLYEADRTDKSIHFNDVDYDGSNIVLGWGSLAVRTLEAAIAVNSYVGKVAEERGLRSPRDAWSKFPPQSGAR